MTIKTVALAGAVIALAGCGTTTAVAAAHSSAPSTRPSTPSSSAPAPAPSTASLTQHVGGVFTDTDPSGDEYSVKLVKVIPYAQGTDEFNQPNAGDHLVAAVITITGMKGTASDDANSVAVLIGSDGQEYNFAIDSVAGYTNFNYGEFNVTAGQTVTGAVVYQLPGNVSAAEVQWAPTFSSSAATWLVS